MFPAEEPVNVMLTGLVVPMADCCVPNGVVRSAPVKDTDPPQREIGVECGPALVVAVIVCAPDEVFGNPNSAIYPLV
jgi:hypothetical protein